MPVCLKQFQFIGGHQIFLNILMLRGFIICENFEEIIYAISKMSDEDYLSKIKWIKKNKKTASYHADFKKRAAQIIKQSLNN